MLNTNYIFDQNDYYIHRRFHLIVLGPASYLIKTIGLDTNKKNKQRKTKKKSETVRGPNEKFALMICRFLKRNERIKKNKLNKRYYEEVEETV